MDALPRSYSPDQWNEIYDRAAKIVAANAEARQAVVNAKLDRLELLPVKEAARRIGKSDEHVRRHFWIHPRGGVRKVDVVAYLEEVKKTEKEPAKS